MNSEIGDVMKLFRKAYGLTQNEVANRLGISINSYSNIEKGRCDLYTSRIELIATLFRIKPHQIILLAEELKNHKDLSIIKKSISYILAPKNIDTKASP